MELWLRKKNLLLSIPYPAIGVLIQQMTYKMDGFMVEVLTKSSNWAVRNAFRSSMVEMIMISITVLFIFLHCLKATKNLNSKRLKLPDSTTTTKTGDHTVVLGGKGTEMATIIGLSVPPPPALTISTEACQEYQNVVKKLPEEGLWEEEIMDEMKIIGSQMGAYLGDTSKPLLLSVRSGAATISMPGVVAGLAEKSGKSFASDSYTRFLDMFGDVVMGISHSLFENELYGEFLVNAQCEDPSAYKEKVIATGLPASPGAAVGQVVFSAVEAEEWHAKGKSVILVTTKTSSEDIGGMHAANGTLTARGGMASHAAVVARGQGKCCICGCSDLRVNDTDKVLVIGDKVIGEGEWLSLNGSTGDVILGKQPLAPPALSPDLEVFMSWVDDVRRLKVMANADTPEDALTAINNDAQGIGLFRTEHMFFASDERIKTVRKMIMAATMEQRQVALDLLLPYQRSDVEGIFRAMDGCPVTIWLLDPPLHEFLPEGDVEQIVRELTAETGMTENDVFSRVEKLSEVNPMLGFRGCRLGISYPELFDGSVGSIDHPNSAFNGGSSEVLLKAKFTDNVEPIFTNFRYSEPTKEWFLFRNSAYESMKYAGTEVITEVKHRDMGTEMTPFGSSTTSRCHTPFKISSPARHNTPADHRSGPFFLKDKFNNNVQPVLSARQGETSSLSPSCGFVAADSLGYVCIVLEFDRWIIMLLIHVDWEKSIIDSEEWEIATPYIRIKELLTDPKVEKKQALEVKHCLHTLIDLPVALPSLCSVIADSFEGRSTLLQYFEFFHENSV